MRHAMTILVLAAAPAAAQDLHFEIDDTVACLDGAGTWVEMESCIGAAANACMSATDMGGTTIGMSDCMDREFTWWDEQLNEVYGQLRTKEQAEDAEYSDLPGAVNQAEALRDMQRAWISFRDTTCDYERAQWGGGTGGGPATVGCLLRTTGEQTVYLQSMLADG